MKLESHELLHYPSAEIETAHGPVIRPDGTTVFRLWAPGCKTVELALEGRAHGLKMTAREDGWHDLAIEAEHGTRYWFALPNGMHVPDPASRFQPADVHGPSEVIDFSDWRWSDTHWKGRPWPESVIYELHVGTFTPEGTFTGAIRKLDYLVDLGVTAIDLMPVADFRGARNWGYDGVLPYAPDSSYGRPEDLKELVEAAHARGLMVIQDVVYNHFGAEGNYISLYAPQFFTDRYRTPWGSAVNFDGAGSGPVREFVIENALYWIKQFHMDGLRLDAVHQIRDESPTHLLEELAHRVRQAVPDRPVHLILENEENEARWLKRDEGHVHCFTAQWNDDAHHVLHTAVTGEDNGYYVEYRDDTVKLGRALAEGFAFQGEMMAYRGGHRGESSSHLPPCAFVAFLQNHDQIGNRAFGDRIGSIASPEALRAAGAAYLLLPQTPMLFMGEEWNASSPFPFFCDFGPELADAVRRGRREEFSKFPEFRDPEKSAQIPDPQAESTFRSAKLRWDELEQPEHREFLDWYRSILARRRETIWPLGPIERGGRFQVVGPHAVVVRWQARPSRELALAANLSNVPVAGFPQIGSRPFWQEGSMEDGTFGPWSVAWWIEDRDKAQ